ncbi:MAG: T9SS type A sorting domain-containing protein [Bacteroidota bacterium]
MNWKNSFLLAFLCLIAGYVLAQPANDNLCNAAVIVVDSSCNGTTNGNLSGASFEAGETAGSCASFLANTESAWFTFTGPSTGFVDIVIDSTLGDQAFYTMVVYTLNGSCIGQTNLTEIACGTVGLFGNGGVSINNLTAASGDTFYIQVVGDQFFPGASFCLEVSSSQAPPPPPANDSICQATILTFGDSCDVSNPNGTLNSATSSTDDPAATCFFPGNNTVSVWYSFTGPDTGDVSLTFTDISTQSVQLAVFELPAGDSCSNPQNLVELQCAITQGDQTLIVNTDSGSLYYVLVTNSFFGSNGDFCLSIDNAVPGMNDQACMASMVPVDGNVYSFSNASATVDPGEDAIAPPQDTLPNTWIENSLNATIWLQFVAPPSGAVEISTCNAGTNFDTQIAVYSASDCNDYSSFTLLAANDDVDGNCNNGNQFASSLQSCFTPGDTFYIMIDGFFTAQGNIDLSLTTVNSPPIGANLIPAAVECPGTTTGSINPNPSGGLGSYSYQWSNGATTEVLSGVGEGTYSVVISDACGNSFADSAIVGPAATLGINAGADAVLCIGDTINIGGNPSAFGGNPFSVNGRLFGIGGNQMFTAPVDQPGQAGLQTTTTASVNGGDFSPQGLLGIDGTNNQLVRIDTTSGGVNIIGSGNPSPGHTWTGLSYNAVNDTLYGVSTNGLNGRMYYINPTDGSVVNGPFLTVTQPLWIAISQTGTAYVLDAATDSLFRLNLQTGEAVSLADIGFNATAVFRLDGSVDDGSGNVYFFDAGAGGGIGGANLHAFDPTTQIINTVGTLAAFTDPSLVAIQAGNAAPYQYQWTASSTLLDDDQPTAMVFPAQNTDYVLTVTDACGTSVSDSITITPHVQFELTAGQIGGSGTGGSMVNVIEGTPPYTYSWSNGATTDAIANVPSGTYTVSVTDAGGCTTSQSIEIWATSIDDELSAGIQDWTIFPNPATDVLNIDISLYRSQTIQIQMIDVKGKVLWRKNGEMLNFSQQISLEAFAAGVYLLQVTTEQGRMQKKIVVR